MYKFEYKDMEFSKDGGLDETLVLDRYAVSVHEGFEIGDTIVFPSRLEDYGAKQVGEIKEIKGEVIVAEDRMGRTHEVESEAIAKPLETQPHEMWTRWAKGASSVEKEEVREKIENDMRWLFDGYRYSLGGRIQLSLGQEHVTGKKAPLTAYNCFVIKSPEKKRTSKAQFLEVLNTAFYEASIMRRGGGVGLNISDIKTVKGADKDIKYTIVLDKSHNDSDEFADRIDKGKFSGSYTATQLPEKSEGTHFIKAIDSVDGLFDNMYELAEKAYSKKHNHIVIDFTGLRHRNAIVKGVNGRSSGAVSWAELFALIVRLLKQDMIDNVDFAEIFSTITNLIEQGGSRRGALMIVNGVENDNVEKFIKRKKTAGYLEGANISVGMTDGFMERVIANKDKGINDAEVELWDGLIESAWDSAEPGIIWMERYNKESNSHYYNTIEATNPCGEVFASR